MDYQFLNFTHPSDAKAQVARRTVRSHVTRQQHQKEQALQAARRASSRQNQVSEPQPPPPPPVTQEAPLDARLWGTAPESREADGMRPQSYQQINPFQLYPREWHQSIAAIEEFYAHNLAIDIPDLDPATTASWLRTRLLPLMYTDKASLHAVMLLAAAHYTQAHGQNSHAVDILSLRGLAIAEINQALREGRQRATSDQLILAVAEMASYEAAFGSRDDANTHMRGLHRMVLMRGGLPSLGLNGFVERVLLWIDSNVCYLLNRNLYFNDLSATPRHPPPDAMKFLGRLRG
ncbi:hypothetical protein K470DRAFT_210331 [Piedraia hortae CBS 480.64]|uniref:Transcription factor domain-containing protein n=1 Tax=Piedraia hortae CBS 480.64 TaxID=1314780 RepID=A0A6A7C8K0_9PEZI|nr:hypothetical protein K470DRAFT_210331 [Piedraia hortae CBS 480.64]